MSVLKFCRKLRAAPARHFREKYGYTDDGPLHSGYLLDIVEELAVDLADGMTLSPVGKARAFYEFTKELNGEERLTEADAEAALTFLQSEGMVEVVGDEIRIPSRFWPA